ncbi:MAG TPA: Fe-S cluster assembly protein SufD [Chthoniobacterales bacterium]|nr:Fe-S cluster assembly protein SufD [Chthoniobacterales bacterium]
MSPETAVLDDVMDVAPPTEPADAAILAGIPAGRSADLPRWFRDQQRSAWETFASLPMPNRKNQAWRFSNVGALDLAPYRHVEARALGNEIVERSHGLDEVCGRLVFADDQLVHRDAIPEILTKRGVIFQPLERAIIEHEELFRRHFMTEPTPLGSAKFAALHQALVRSGAFLYVPRGVEIDLPIEIFHWLNAPNAAVFPHLLLLAEEMSKVAVIEHFRSADPRYPGFACGVNDLIAGAGAKVVYTCTQNWGANVSALQMNATTVARDASAMSLNVHLGAAYSRFESFSRMTGEGARSDLLAVALAQGAQEFDARTLQDHRSAHTTSDLLYKNALDDRSRTIFGGLIRVEPHAHFTDAYQTVRNLLLSDDAEANSMPGLEILADNVKCSHGATSGQLHEEEMFYLLARGIPAPVARQLLVTGFLNEAVDRIENSAIRALVEEMAAAKLARSRN